MNNKEVQSHNWGPKPSLVSLKCRSFDTLGRDTSPWASEGVRNMESGAISFQDEKIVRTFITVILKRIYLAERDAANYEITLDSSR